MNLSAALFVTFPGMTPVVDPAPTDTVPLEIVVPPEKEFRAVNMRTLDEFIDRAPAPEMIPASVWLELGDMLSVLDAPSEMAPL